MLECLTPWFDHLVVTRYQKNPRACDPMELEQMLIQMGYQSYCLKETPAEAWDYVRRQTDPRRLVCVAGSFYLAAEMRRLIAERPLNHAQNAALGTI